MGLHIGWSLVHQGGLLSSCGRPRRPHPARRSRTGQSGAPKAKLELQVESPFSMRAGNDTPLIGTPVAGGNLRIERKAAGGAPNQQWFATDKGYFSSQANPRLAIGTTLRTLKEGSVVTLVDCAIATLTQTTFVIKKRTDNAAQPKTPRPEPPMNIRKPSGIWNPKRRPPLFRQPSTESGYWSQYTPTPGPVYGWPEAISRQMLRQDTLPGPSAIHSSDPYPTPARAFTGEHDYFGLPLVEEPEELVISNPGPDFVHKVNNRSGTIDSFFKNHTEVYAAAHTGDIDDAENTVTTHTSDMEDAENSATHVSDIEDAENATTHTSDAENTAIHTSDKEDAENIITHTRDVEDAENTTTHASNIEDAENTTTHTSAIEDTENTTTDWNDMGGLVEGGEGGSATIPGTRSPQGEIDRRADSNAIENDLVTECIDPGYDLTKAMNRTLEMVPMVAEPRPRPVRTATKDSARSARQLLKALRRDSNVVLERSMTPPEEAASPDGVQVTRMRPVRQLVEAPLRDGEQGARVRPVRPVRQPEEAPPRDGEQVARMRPVRQTVRQSMETAPHDDEQVETVPHDDEQVETVPHDDEHVAPVSPVKQTVKPTPPGDGELRRSPSARKVEVSKPVPDHVAINMSVTRDDSVDITERIGLSSTVEDVVDDLVLVALHPFNEDGVDITVDAIPDSEPELEPAEPLAKQIPQGPQLPPITDKSYIKYSHSVWESVIRHKYRHKDRDVIPADKHILRGVAEVSLRKEVARLLTLNTTPIPEESMYLYVKKKEEDMPFLEEEKMSPTSHKGKNNHTRRHPKGGMFAKPKSDTLETVSEPKKTSKKGKEKKPPEPLIVDEKSNQLVPTDFMIDVSAVFPTIIAHYPKYAQKVLCRVGYTKVTLVKRKPGKSSSDEHNIVQLRLLSEFPFMYGRVSFDRNLRLTWYRSPFKWLLYQMRLMEENKTKTLHALCIVPLRRICAFEYLNEEDDSHLYRSFRFDCQRLVFVYGDPPIRQNGIWKAHSVFTEIVHSENAQEVFEADFWDVVLDFKWRSYAAFRWLLIWLVEIIYMVLWFVSTNPMVQRYPANSDPPAWPAWSVQFQIGAISLGSLFLCHEIRQLIYHGPKKYFLNVYNFIDLLCYILPITISVNNLQAGYVGTQTDLTALTILLLWLHFLQQLRVFKAIGIFVNTLLSGVKQIIPFLAVVFVILVGFGHGTWALLGNYDTGPKGDPNAFSSFSTSLKNTYWGITGDMSGLQAWDGFSHMADIFRFMFTFVAMVYLLNLLIAMLGDNYAEAFQDAGASFRLQRAKAIAEIECFWMLPRERRNKTNFPDDIFYEAKPDDIHEWEEENKPGDVKFD
ncbi:hypothetical protein BC938DRAFT_473573 [Jimgerdemannia flammicorona]|uniref:Ion transport domain-containing protein n=1 Tax=Jimgerdemannia flammicorona TaxID=994334 RepID=A0A433QT80_9FUNG|nr:hypothetical protein BC938DRAFT_473573 [Jimgerdemannia flammicorona]